MCSTEGMLLEWWVCIHKYKYKVLCWLILSRFPTYKPCYYEMAGTPGSQYCFKNGTETSKLVIIDVEIIRTFTKLCSVSSNCTIEQGLLLFYFLTLHILDFENAKWNKNWNQAILFDYLDNVFKILICSLDFEMCIAKLIVMLTL